MVHYILLNVLHVVSAIYLNPTSYVVLQSLHVGRHHRGSIIPQAVTQSSAPEDGQNNFRKHVELTGIIN